MLTPVGALFDKGKLIMKKLFAALLITVLSIVGLCACGGIEFELNFIVDSEIYDTVKTSGKEVVEIPTNPTKDGYTFGGWYWDKDEWNKPFTANSLLDAPISSNMSVYAKWNCVHSASDWIIDTEATCKAEGAKHKECTECGEVLETGTIDKLTTHTPVEAVTENYVDSTCKTEGSYNSVVYCSVCGEKLSNEAKTVEKKNHTPSDWITDTEATCKAAGAKHKECTACRDVLETGTIEKLTTHTPAEAVTENHVDSTCKAEGSYNSVVYCSVCGEKLSSEAKVVAKKDHTPGGGGKCTFCNLIVRGTEGVVYNVSGDGTHAVVVSYIGSAKNVVIAEEYDGKPVTKIKNNAFDGKSINSILIPDSIMEIGDYAFYNCSTMTDVTVGNGLLSVGTDAFALCTGLMSVHITDISKWCAISFENHSANPLSCANDLYIGTEAVRNLVIPVGVESIGNYAFYNCIFITDLTISNGVVSIGSSAFSYCRSITEITVPESVESIGSSAFSFCTGLSNATLGNGVINIGANAFDGCSSLTSVTVGNKLKNIGDYAFANCPILASVNIPESTVRIGDYAFSLSGLTALTVPNSVKSIGDYAFYGCSGLGRVNLGSGIVSIGDSAFYGCRAIEDITIPDSVTVIGDFAFSACYGLTNLYINDIAKWCAISFGNYDSNPLNYASNFYVGGELLTELVIPDGVTSIGNYTFYGWDSLSSLTVRNGLTSVGAWAFYGCTALENIYYTGTEAEWNAITKGTGWDNGTGSYTATYNHTGE